MGAHGLRVTKAAWADGGRLDRRERLCECCSMDIVEDEMHVIFECPIYSSLRQHFRGLFGSFSLVNNQGHITLLISDSTEDMMQRFMGQADQFLIGTFIGKCMAVRAAHLD